MEQPPLFVVILEEGRAYTSLGKSSWNLLLMEHCGVSQGRQRVPVSSEALERNTSLGLEKMPPPRPRQPVVQCDWWQPSWDPSHIPLEVCLFCSLFRAR